MREKLQHMFPRQEDIVLWSGWQRTAEHRRRAAWLGVWVTLANFARVFVMALLRALGRVLMGVVLALTELTVPFVWAFIMLRNGFAGNVGDRASLPERYSYRTRP